MVPFFSALIRGKQLKTTNKKMKITTFSCYTSKQPVESPLEAVVECIRSDKSLKSLTETYRQTGSRHVKQESPLFMVAAIVINGKGSANIVRLTGLSLVDIDHLEPERMEELRKKAHADPHTLMCYTTISGSGLRIIFTYESNGQQDTGSQKRYYPKVFAAGNDYYERLLGVETDRQCKNVTRLSGLAHDPGVYFNPRAVVFTVREIADSYTATTGGMKAQARRSGRIDDYFAGTVAPRLESEGLAYVPGRHNEYVMRVGYMMAARRYNMQAVTQWAVEKFHDYDGTEGVIRSCYKGVAERTQSVRRQASAATASAGVAELQEWLGEKVELRHNTVTQRIEYRMRSRGDKAEWALINDRAMNSIWLDMSAEMKVNPFDLIRVIESDYTPSFNPFLHYLKSLRKWSPGDTDHIARLAATVTLKRGSRLAGLDFTNALRKWLVAMVAAWIDPEVVNHVILVLIGKQGAYKTTWFNYLLPPELRKYFYTKANSGRMTKDDLLVLSQYGLICCEELDTMRPAELNQLKAAVTMQSTNERAAYAHFHEQRRHIASFCGTGNNPQFLTDPTGNRRWLPFEVESILSPREHPFDYEGIYSQAYALYLSGFEYWFSSEEMEAQARHNSRFESPNLERELVSLYFRKPLEGERPIFVSAARAMQIIGAGIAQKLSAIRIGLAFKELGFKSVKYNGTRGYMVMQRTVDEMMMYQKNMSSSELEDCDAE